MKKIITILSILLCISLTFIGCGNSAKETDNGKSDVIDTDSNESTEDNDNQTVAEDSQENEGNQSDNDTASDNSTAKNPGELNTIAELSDYWNNLYTGNEEAINAYEMPILDLLLPATSFIIGIQYDLLNLTLEDGRFEGELMLAGYPGFVEKNGSLLTFGYEDVLEEDSFNALKGDKLNGKGNCDLENGYYFADSFKERNGAMIDRDTTEFQIESDGSMSTISLEGGTLNWNNKEDLTTTYVFIRNGKGQYDFVLANSTVGTQYEVLHLEADMTKEKAVTLFEAAGATITKTGGIKDGVFYVDGE